MFGFIFFVLHLYYLLESSAGSSLEVVSLERMETVTGD